MVFLLFITRYYFYTSSNLFSSHFTAPRVFLAPSVLFFLYPSIITFGVLTYMKYWCWIRVPLCTPWGPLESWAFFNVPAQKRVCSLSFSLLSFMYEQDVTPWVYPKKVYNVILRLSYFPRRYARLLPCNNISTTTNSRGARCALRKLCRDFSYSLRCRRKRKKLFYLFFIKCCFRVISKFFVKYTSL